VASPYEVDRFVINGILTIRSLCVCTTPHRMDAFITHLAASLSWYETSSFSTNRDTVQVSSYDGPTDARTDSINRSVSAIMSRMWKAEEALLKFQKEAQVRCP
jgi:hypothetical protein